MKKSFYEGGLLVIGMIAGVLTGYCLPIAGSFLGAYVDHIVLVLVFLLFFGVQVEDLVKIAKHYHFLTVAWAANFILVPGLGFLIASLFLSGKPLFFTGLMIYFMAPCTDWMLGFTKLAKGNVALGAILIPINMLSQLLLYPLYLWLFAGKHADVPIPLFTTVLDWFIIPFFIAVALRMLLKRYLTKQRFASCTAAVGVCVPYIIAVLILMIFAANVGAIFLHIGTFSILLIAVFVFFVGTYFVGEKLSDIFRFDRPDRVLLAMTTAARNAPLMLAVTVVAIPDQPLIYAAIIIGMLLEFPHLTVLTMLVGDERLKKSATI